MHNLLYGLDSSGLKWHDKFADCMITEYFPTCYTEFGIWIQPNGNTYEYKAIHVDDFAFAVKIPRLLLTHLKGSIISR